MIPVATTTVSIRRPALSATVDGYDPQPSPSTIASGVRAHFSAPIGTELLGGGSKETIDRHLDCDPTDLEHTDQVVDELTGVTYDVVWAHERTGLGLDRIEAGVRRTKGLA